VNTVWFHEDAGAASVGGKGQSLCRMWQAGLPVPAGFCVTRNMLDRPDLEQHDIALTKLGARHVAVRSSAILEDTAAASFAGIYLTRLNIAGAERVAEALLDVRNSAFAASAAAYSRRQNVAECCGMAAVVQRFVAAEASGISWTGDVVNVEASGGLGESVVGGLVTPDRWILSRNGQVISSKIADKDVATVGGEDAGTRQVKVEPARRRRACLTSESLQQIFELAGKCHELFGGSQNIEWALESDRVWILQSRPVTANSGTVA